MAEFQLDLEKQCVAASKEGNHDKTGQPGDVTTDYKLSTDQKEPSFNVALLHSAAYLGWLDVIKKLKGVNKFNCSDSEGYGPLHYAVATARDDISIVEYLINEQGCDPLLSSKAGNLPLHTACKYGNFNATKYFIAIQKCNPNSRGIYEYTPLHCASLGGHIEIIQYLISELGCDPLATNSNGCLPVHLACVNGHLNVVKYFITEQKYDPNSQGEQGFTLLHCASRGGHMDIIQYLISELGCDPLATNSKGSLPVHIACSNGHLNVVKFFINKQKYDPNSRGEEGITLLHCASRGGHMDIIQYLISELGCDPLATNSNGCLPLHLASVNGHLNVVKFFINEQKCDPNSRGEKGSTLLHYASLGGHMDIIQYLISELGCDPLATNRNGSLPVHIACSNGHLNVVKFFINEQKYDPNSRGEEGITLLHCASRGGHMDIIQYLISELGCDPLATNSNGCLPLHLASVNGHLNVVKFFINEQKYDPNSRGEEGITLLHCASRGGHMDIIQYLISELGCDPLATNSNGCLPLHLASVNGHLNVVKFFINEQKCDPNSRGEKGSTLLHYASLGGHMDIIQYLISELGCDPLATNRNGSLPVHIACSNGHLNAVKFFINEKNCDPNCQNKSGSTLLHHASQGGHMDIIQYLISELGCDPSAIDSSGSLPVHLACVNGHLNAVKFFINEQKCDPNSRGEKRSTLLHYASHGGHMDIIQYLINELGCDPKTPNSNGDLPLHTASLKGHLNAVKFFITKQKCDLNTCSRSKKGYTPLHYASQGGHMDIMQYLITELGCGPNIPNSNGSFPLHIVCLNGHLNAVKYLVAEKNCDPNGKNKTGSIPLHYASQSGHVDVIKYLISEQGCNPLTVDNTNRTALHRASQYGRIDVVKWLLRNTQVDLTAKDINGDTCIGLASNHFEILKIFRPLVDSSQNFPIHKFGKAVLTGNGAAGKTTLNKVIESRATKQSMSFFDSLKKIENVETNTAGIVSSQVESNEVGNMVLYDLAGQAEYHSSHFAIMETVIQQSPATFINVVDLRNKDDEIKRQLHYWLNFIDNATCRTTARSCLIVVGSHADFLSKKEIQSKSNFIANVLDNRPEKRQDFVGVVTMDCRKFDSKDTRKLVSLISQCQLTLSARAPSMSYYCHLLYALLKSKSIDEIPYCRLEELILLISNNDCPIPADLPFLSGLLKTLNDKGMLIFLKNHQNLQESWIVLNVNVLLKKINGKLFGKFRSATTGLIQPSILMELFPQHNLEMLVRFLQTLELCHPVKLSGLETNLTQDVETPHTCIMKKFLFFPSLLNICRPNILLCEEVFSFGWYLCCKAPDHHFFTSRFLHVLLLRLAYTFPLANDTQETFHHNQTGCNVWNNGISWENEEGIRTIVEVIDNQKVLVLASHKSASRPVECNKHHCAVVRLILNLQQQFCPNVETAEYLISHSLLRNWTTVVEIQPDKCDLFPIENVARSMLLDKPYIHNCNRKASNDFLTKNVLEFEPYYQLNSFVCELMDSSKADEQVYQALLEDVQTVCKLKHRLKRQTYSSLRKLLDEFSLFGGRNPIVSN